MALYDRLRVTAGNLLSKYGQGVVEIGSTVSAPGANPWDAPTVTTQWEAIDAVVRGVSAQYVDGVTIVSTDKQVLFQG